MNILCVLSKDTHPTSQELALGKLLHEKTKFSYFYLSSLKVKAYMVRYLAVYCAM